jgi:hypothetical protein
MFVMTPQHYDAVRDLFADIVRDKDRTVIGQTQKERAYEEGRLRGVREGKLEGIAAILNTHRCKKYAQMGRLPKLTGHDLHIFCKEALEKYQEVVGEHVEPSKSKGDYKERVELESKFYKWLLEEFDKVAFPDDLEKDYLEWRQSQILSGKMEPTDEDKRSWLADELERRRTEAEKIESLLK